MIKPNAKNRSTRLKKKLYVDEFATLGFSIQYEFSHEFTVAEQDGFLDGLLDIIEAHELLFAGGCSRVSGDGVVYSNKRYGSVTKQDQQIINDWLASNEKLANFQVKPLFDLTYECD